MDFDAYRAIPALNWSLLKHMATSPLAFKHAFENDRDDSTRLLLGRAVHTAVLEPDYFPLRYAVYGGERRAGKDWAAFQAANAGKDVLKASEYQLCLDIRDAVHAHPAASRLLTGGEAEVVRLWDEDGRTCKARLDYLSSVALVDLKTTSSVDLHDFTNTLARYLYHGQVAYYGRDLEPLPAYIIAVEMDAPHDVGVFRLPEWVLDAGDCLVTRLLTDLDRCEEEDRWPGRYEYIQEISLPAWMTDETDPLEGW